MTHLDINQVLNVEGLVALITGGGTGIGLMIAKGLAVNGAKVYIGGRRKDVLDKAASENGQEIKGQIVPIQLDVANKGSIEHAVNFISSNDGKLDILINNAGIASSFTSFFLDPSSSDYNSAESLGSGLFRWSSFEDWSNMFSVNTTSAFFVSMAFLGLLEKGSKVLEADTGGLSSSIINVSSMAGQLKQVQTHFAYNLSKAALNHLTKMLSTELALRSISIRVNSIAPGPFPSQLTGLEGSVFMPDKVDSVLNGITTFRMHGARWPG
ncbi:unnamed protein product [Rhizoctonia solani]|uniref:Rhamnolipids biosynthesis 3-oxoacyl-[acyl-carrier-protein] reductase n=1 Tax=Rhizoctonia solani TaxID=456999 RepID=A0A8H3CKR3_9AGAM|nr:unnamed protein product [Rhizoctonia solani]CAE6514082.1 unnamed protein product [Rhizoctonia solani]